LKSQYGQRDRQNGQWIYKAIGSGWLIAVPSG